jgi:L-lactate permease
VFKTTRQNVRYVLAFRGTAIEGLAGFGYPWAQAICLRAATVVAVEFRSVSRGGQQ